MFAIRTSSAFPRAKKTKIINQQAQILPWAFSILRFFLGLVMMKLSTIISPTPLNCYV